MNTPFTIDIRAIQRIACAMLVALLVVAGLPWLQPGHASADQFANRSIQLSDASPSGGSITSGIGSGAAVSYQVTFTPTHQAGSMVIDFCSNDPIISDTCTAPTAMNAASVTISNVAGTLGGTGWTATGAASQVKLADDGVSGHDIQAATQQILKIDGITNPSTVGTFYARMYTYTDNAYNSTTTYASPTSVGGYVDYGGTAMSITNVITITARVQESLTFCVTKAAPSSWTTNHDCSDPNIVGTAGANLPSLILGHGSPTAVLDNNTIDTGNVYSSLSTNATHGAVINIHNSNTSCGGLSADSGTTCAIPAINSGSATPSAMTAGTAAFGLFVANGVADTGDPSNLGIGSTTATGAYNDGHVTVPSDVHYGMDTQTTAGAFTSVPSTYKGSVLSTFGSVLAYTTAPCYRVDNTYTFAATSALTTPAGIYTANLSMIATGTF